MSTDLISLFGAIQRGDTREIASHIFPQGPQQPMPGIPALVERPSPTAGIGTADAGTSSRCQSCGAPLYASYASCTTCLTAQVSEYQVTCRARYYDAASRILEEEGQLFRHANADELGQLIQQWIEQKRNNLVPR